MNKRGTAPAGRVEGWDWVWNLGDATFAPSLARKCWTHGQRPFFGHGFLLSHSTVDLQLSFMERICSALIRPIPNAGSSPQQSAGFRAESIHCRGDHDSTRNLSSPFSCGTVLFTFVLRWPQQFTAATTGGFQEETQGSLCALEMARGVEQRISGRDQESDFRTAAGVSAATSTTASTPALGSASCAGWAAAYKSGGNRHAPAHKIPALPPDSNAPGSRAVASTPPDSGHRASHRQDAAPWTAIVTYSPFVRH
jgi:hypothetical protein